MGIFLRERRMLIPWVMAAVIGVALAYLLNVIYYQSVGVSIDHRSFGWSRVGFGHNGELATVGLIALAYFGIRMIMSVMGVRGAWR